MGWEHRISQILEVSEMLYAVGQGALAVECRLADCSKFSHLSHIETLLRTVAERSLLCTLGGGCSAPVAVSSQLEGDILYLTGACWSLDGAIMEEMSSKCSLAGEGGIAEQDLFCGVSDSAVDRQKLSRAYKLGVDLANGLIERGALKIIEEAKSANNAP